LVLELEMNLTKDVICLFPHKEAFDECLYLFERAQGRGEVDRLALSVENSCDGARETAALTETEGLEGCCLMFEYADLTLPYSHSGLRSGLWPRAAVLRARQQANVCAGMIEILGLCVCVCACLPHSPSIPPPFFTLCYFLLPLSSLSVSVSCLSLPLALVFPPLLPSRSPSPPLSLSLSRSLAWPLLPAPRESKSAQCKSAQRADGWRLISS